MSEKIFPDTLLTTAGRQMIVDSQGGSTLTFTRVALGDGVLAQGQDQSALTAIISEKLSANISSYTDNEDGTFSLVFSVNNSTLDVGFMHREIGIMAKVDDGEEQLYAYTNAGTAATFLYDKTTPIQERVVRIDFVVGSAGNLSVEIDGSVVYPTRGEVQQMIGAHNTGSDSHADLLHLRKPSTTYAVGDIAYSPQLPSWARLEAVNNGTTGTGELPITGITLEAGQYIADGTVKWIIDDIRDGDRVGDVVFHSVLLPGHILADGAALADVSTDYLRLLRWARANNMTTLDSTDMGKYYYDSEADTLRVPKADDGRFIEGSTMAGTSHAAGLPNIEGSISTDSTSPLFSLGGEWGDISNPSVVKNEGALSSEAFTSNMACQEISYTGGQRLKSITFDASRSSSIYGNSDTVQPKALTSIAQIKY